VDEAFFMRAKRLLGERQPLRLDHDDLVSQVKARQAETPTARFSEKPVAVPRQAACGTDMLATLLLCQTGWRGAVQIQHGCFNRAAAKRPVNQR
jgi:hypothetical protein